MRASVAEFSKKLKIIRRVIPRGTTAPVLQNVLVADGYLTATDMTEAVIRAKIDEADGDPFLIPMKAFDMIQALPPGMMEIRPTNPETIQIRNEEGGINSQYSTMDPKNFPTLENVQGDKTTVPGTELVTALKHVMWAAGSQASSMSMASVNLRTSDGMLSIAATNGHVISWDKVTEEGSSNMTIPVTAAKYLIAINPTVNVRITAGKNWASFAMGEFELRTRLIEGDYYHYPGLFQEMPNTFRIRREELLNAVARAKFCRTANVPVKFDISPGELDVMINDSTASYTETVPISYRGDNIVIGFNPDFLTAALECFTEDELYISLKDGINAVTIGDDGTTPLKVLILPVRLPDSTVKGR